MALALPEVTRLACSCTWTSTSTGWMRNATKAALPRSIFTKMLSCRCSSTASKETTCLATAVLYCMPLYAESVLFWRTFSGCATRRNLDFCHLARLAVLVSQYPTVKFQTGTNWHWNLQSNMETSPAWHSSKLNEGVEAIAVRDSATVFARPRHVVASTLPSLPGLMLLSALS